VKAGETALAPACLRRKHRSSLPSADPRMSGGLMPPRTVASQVRSVRGGRPVVAASAIKSTAVVSTVGVSISIAAVVTVVVSVPVEPMQTPEPPAKALVPGPQVDAAAGPDARAYPDA
jgi:hypothetical protein